ncbi:MAG: uncharacterized protein JWN93_2688 [Hyphomicrobiales bacterium]|nr:uncharacterized protein [Hyphomicrobiales bacterium]
MASSPRRPSRPRPLSDLVGAALHPVAAKQGFGESDIILHWGDIIGPRLAAVSEPLRLQWAPRPPNRSPDAPPEPATLIVRMEGAFAIELQHLAPIVIERVNARLGWRCIGRIAVRQGPVRKAPPRRPPPAPVDPDAALRAQAAAAPILDDGLRAALARLGTAAMSDPKNRRKEQ